MHVLHFENAIQTLQFNRQSFRVLGYPLSIPKHAQMHVSNERQGAATYSQQIVPWIRHCPTFVAGLEEAFIAQAVPSGEALTGSGFTLQHS